MLPDKGKTKEQLINELKSYRQHFEESGKERTGEFQNNREEFDQIFDLLVDIIAVSDLKTGFFTKVNPAFSRIIGYSQEEILNTPFMDFLHPDDRDKTIDVVADELASDDLILYFENRYRCKDGSYKWIAWTSQPLSEKGITFATGRDITAFKDIEIELESHRKHLEILVDERTAELKRTNEKMAREITERKQAEEAVKESERKYRAIFDEARDGIVLIDSQTANIVDCNLEFERQTGRKIGQLREMKVWEVRPPEKIEEAKEKFLNVKEKGTGGSAELEFQRPDGEIVPVEFVSKSITIGGEHYLQSMVRDITERKQAEEALKESEEKYRFLFDNMLNGYAYCQILVDENNKPVDFVYLEINDAFEKLTGLRRENVVGRKITEAIPGTKEATPELFDIYGKVALTGEPTEFELYFKPLSIWLAISVYSPQKGYFVAVFDDITERKQAEEKEKKLQQKLNLTSRLAAVGELAAGVGHEINNPLTEVLGFSERLLRKNTNEEMRLDLERIHDEAQRIAKVMDNLRTFTRRRDPEKQYSDINDILQKALELRAYELQTGNIEVVTDLASGLPEIEVNFHQIQEVFLNIILDAEQAMTETHGRSKLTIKTGEIKDYVRTSFTDDGPGILAEHLDKLFDPFFTTRGEQGGTGLGLSVCYSIVTEHGGRLYVKSKPGKGTTFFVELPCS